MSRFHRLVLLLNILLLLTLSVGSVGAETAANYLIEVMDQFHDPYYNVYTDSHAAGNHFVYPARMPENGDWVPSMKECFPVPVDPKQQKPVATSKIYKDLNWIECTYDFTKERDPFFGGWYFMNGLLEGDEVAPKENWGKVPNAGILDLNKATKISFWAKGAQGGEKVEFFCFGVGWNPDTRQRVEDYADSSPKVSFDPNYTSLNKDWTYYEKSLSKKNLKYVLGGFGWVTRKEKNPGKDSITFYLDDIRFHKARPNDPRFLVSYTTEPEDPANPPPHKFDIVLRNTAFTYDNSVALLAFLALKQNSRAKLLADALVYAYQNDRYYQADDYRAPDSRRLRNAYKAGALKLWPGWTPHTLPKTAAMPGFPEFGRYPNCGNWKEDEYQVSTDTGNVAWAMLALLGYYEANGKKAADRKYLNTAKSLGKWVAANCQDFGEKGGFTGGFKGWEPSPQKPAYPEKITYKSTEHNIDLFAAFWRLYKLTGASIWKKRANHARNFVKKMWSEDEGHFWTGTYNDGDSENKEVIPLDVHSWAYLARLAGRKAFDYPENNLRKDCGYDFGFNVINKPENEPDGIWYEGSAQMALTYAMAGKKADKSKYVALLKCIKAAQYSHGGIPAASFDGLTTGFLLSNNIDPWLYYKRAHVATAWLILAETKANPFWLGYTGPLPAPAVAK